MKIGVISDTHDLLRPEVISALSGVDAILHAGDISSPQILDRLQKTAPVYAVRGNADKEWAEDLPLFREILLDGLHICMTHKKKDLPQDLSQYDLAVTGHSHQYAEIRQGRTLILNPGSCGPRRFYQKITMAVVNTENSKYPTLPIPGKPVRLTSDPKLRSLSGKSKKGGVKTTSRKNTGSIPTQQSRSPGST